MRREKETKKQELDNRLNEVNYEAQRVIVSETISATRKDFVVDEIVKEIGHIAEERAEYFGKHGDGRRNGGVARRP